MTKKLNTNALVHELEGSAFFPPKRVEPEKTPRSTGEDQQPPKEPQSNQQPINQPANQLVDQSTNRPTDRLTNKVVDRPKAFYITQSLDRRLDEAVRYLHERHGIKRVDRSAIVNAILDNQAQWTLESLDLLVDRVISQLTSRLTT